MLTKIVDLAIAVTNLRQLGGRNWEEQAYYWKACVDTMQMGLDRAQREAQEARSEANDLRQRVESLEADLARARRPWWKQLLRIA